ncbi:MAG: hypothetical protein KBB01_03490 [Candidatus Omnitrophica bacterium]|jgi:hypothetical protein|nr:hypothetical protein [Candidatus Omnitrophota bacterium]
MPTRIYFKLSFFIFFIFLVFTDVSAQYTIDPEEYLVYSTVIEDWFTKSDIELIIIRDYTSLDEPLQILETTLNHLSQVIDLSVDTIRDFKAKNTQSYHLKNFFNQHLECRLINDEEVSKIFDVGGWKEFYLRYPKSNGILAFSRVGFNSDKTRCLVYASNQEDKIIAEGFYYSLTKSIYNNWLIESRQRTWGTYHREID